MKKIALLSIIILAVAATIVLASIYAQTPIQPVMAEIPFDLEQDNPVPMALHWEKDDKSYYYFNWGVKPTTGYRLEFDGIEKNKMTIRAVSPLSDEIVAQVQTYPKLLLVLPKGSYDYRVVDQFGRALTSVFQPEKTPLAFKVYLPAGESWATRRVWRELSTANKGKTAAQIAGEALMAQPEMKVYAQQGLQVLDAVRQGDQWYVHVSKAYLELGHKEKASFSEALRRTVLGLKTKGMKAVEIGTDARR